MMSSLERERSCKKAGSDLALCSAGLVYWFQEHLITCWINILLPCSQTELFTSVYIARSSLPDGAWLHSFVSDLPIRCYPICCGVTWSLTRSAATASARSHLLHVSNLPFCKYPLTWQDGNCVFFSPCSLPCRKMWVALFCNLQCMRSIGCLVRVGIGKRWLNYFLSGILVW